MLFGERSQLNEEIRELYSVSGIAHILAISGLHISIIGGLLYTLLRKRFSFVTAFVVALFLVVAFGMMVGMGIATLRAIVMFVLKIFSEVLGRTFDALTAISFAGILLIINNPFVIFHSGFQMSFAAIITIMMVIPQIRDVSDISNKKILVPISSFIISVCMNPWIAYHYFQLPTYSWLLNLIVVPLMSVVMLFGFGAGVVGLAGVSNPLLIWLGRVLLLPSASSICLIPSELSLVPQAVRESLTKKARCLR